MIKHNKDTKSVNYINQYQIDIIKEGLSNLQLKWKENQFNREKIISDLNLFFRDREMPRVIPNISYEVGNIADYYPKVYKCTEIKRLGKWIDLNSILAHCHSRDKLYSNKEYEIRVIACVWLHNNNLCNKACKCSYKCKKDLPFFTKILDHYFVGEGKHRTYAHFLLGFNEIKVDFIEYEFLEVAKNYYLFKDKSNTYKIEKKFGIERSIFENFKLNSKAISNLKSINIEVIEGITTLQRLKRVIKNILSNLKM